MNTENHCGEFVCQCGKKFENSKSLSRHRTWCKVFQEAKKQKEKELSEEREARKLPNGMFKCENPDCGKEHDGSFGSGRFCCKSCYCSFNSKKQTHFPSIEDLKKRKGFGKSPKEGGWLCSICNITFRTRRELDAHRKAIKHPNNQGWSKGLTKETDKRVLQYAKNISKSMLEGYSSGRLKITPETRKKLSLQRKDFLAKNPEKHPNRILCNTKKNFSYPEQVVNDWLASKKVKFEPQFHWHYTRSDGTLHQRYVDFYVEEYSLFIEVDGAYWHKDSKQIDEAKDRCAKLDGFITLRIDPSKKIIGQLEDFFKRLGGADLMLQ